MRRALSIFLTLFFAIGPLTALFGETDDARLPACCRHHGAHHCTASNAALAQVIGSRGHPVFTAPAQCPLYPHWTPAPTSSAHALAAVHTHAIALLVAGYRPLQQDVIPADLSSLSLSVRGPPSRSFC